MLYNLIYYNIHDILIKAFNNFYKPTLGLRYIYTGFRMQSIGMAGVPTSDIYSDRPIFSLQGKS